MGMYVGICINLDGEIIKIIVGNYDHSGQVTETSLIC